MKKKNKQKIEQPPAPPTKEPKLVKKTYTRRTFMLALGLAIATFGFAGFVIYFFTQNMIVGGPSVFMMAGGIFLFWYFWNKEGTVYKQIMPGETEKQANCVCIYNNWVRFESRDFPADYDKGYPWEIKNTHEFMPVLITPGDYKPGIDLKHFKPLALPDQQYFDPEVFGQRVIGLPAHRRIFKRKEKLLGTIKTVLLVVTTIVLWILVLTTTGGG